MDPSFHQLSTNTQVLLNVFESLTKQDALQRVEPSLATEWEAIDDTTWRFSLREGVNFHDGTDFTAKDVIYTYCRVPLVEDSPSSFTIYTGTIADMQAEDDHTLVITTKAPHPLLPTEIAQLPIYRPRPWAPRARSPSAATEPARGWARCRNRRPSARPKSQPAPAPTSSTPTPAAPNWCWAASTTTGAAPLSGSR